MVAQAPGLTILVTRPEPGASATAEKLRRAGHRPILSPCLTITETAINLPREQDAVLITSAQALPALVKLPKSTKIFTVGDATAARAHEAGFRAVTSAAGTAADLAALVTDRLPRGAKLLFATGACNGGDLTIALRNAGFRVYRRVAYRTTRAPSLTDSTLAALDAGGIDRVLIFSPATGRHFRTLIRRAGCAQALRGAIAIAISAEAAAPLASLPFASIRTAVAPDQEHMLAILS